MLQNKCAVRGAILPGVMCGHIVVVGKRCAYHEKCEHQIKLCGACEGLGYHPTGDSGVKCGGCNGTGISEI